MPALYIVIEGESAITKRINDYLFQIPNLSRPDLIFEREEDAILHAKKLAGDKVGKEMIIMKSVLSLSARKPTIVVKTYNEKGECIPV